MNNKSTLQEIKARFDKDVERFSNLETGQQSTLDAALNMDLIINGILNVNPFPKEILDIGCGAGNYTVKLLQNYNKLNCSLVDLSLPMLNKAKERVELLIDGEVNIYQQDLRTIEFKKESFDVIIATAVLHHLRDEDDWKTVFAKLYSLLKKGGSLWIFDLVSHEIPAIHEELYVKKYGSYLKSLKDDNYKNAVFEYIEKEDSPRSLNFQLDLLKKVGFNKIDVLHKNLCFASFVGVK